MKLRFLLLLLLGFSMMQYSIAQVQDNFDDGNFDQNPTWLGSDTLWQVQNGMLNSLSQSANSSFHISTAQNLLDSTEWIWRSFLDFSTSSKNYVDFHLNNDSSDLSGKGYFVRIGNTKDDISFYKIDASGNEQILINGPDAQVGSKSDFEIKVTHIDSVWKLYSKDLKNNQNIFSLIDSVVDNTIQSTAFFGIEVTQSTSSFFGKHYFDDVLVQKIVEDTVAPSLSSIAIIDNRHIEVVFDEAIDTGRLNLASFSIQNLDPISFSQDSLDWTKFYLSLAKDMISTQYELRYSQFYDFAGNAETNGSYNFEYFKAGPYSLIISELMADFNPSVGMPDCKWIELYNNSGKSLDITNWKLVEDGDSTLLPNYIMPAGSFLLLTSSTANAAKMSPFGPVVASTNFPGLAVSGSSLEIRNEQGDWIFSMRYDKDSYQNAIKSEGGYSLELIDTNFACEGYRNYRASDKGDGASPAQANSVWGVETVQATPLAVQGIKLNTAEELEVFFNKSLDPNPSIDLEMSDGITATLKNNLTQSNKILVTFNTALQENKVYSLNIKNLGFCQGETANIQLGFGKPSMLNPNDVIFNEVMFEAAEGFHDWVEIKNNSTKVLDASGLYLASKDDQSNIIDIHRVDNNRQLLPGQYYVIGNDNALLMSQKYRLDHPENIINPEYSFSLNSSEDVITLLDASGSLIDDLTYSSNWEYPLLNDSKGVSLERIDENAKTQDKNNWHSASEASGWATPTSKNSSFVDGSYEDAQVSISSPIISPNGDGTDDFVFISYKLENPGYLMDIRVFDVAGGLRAEPVKNESIDTKGRIRWDGLDDNGQVLEHGPYILYVELRDDKGQKIPNKFSLIIEP